MGSQTKKCFPKLIKKNKLLPVPLPSLTPPPRQDRGRGWSEIRAAEVDSLFRERHLPHLPGLPQRVRPGPGGERKHRKSTRLQSGDCPLRPLLHWNLGLIFQDKQIYNIK